MSLKKIYTNEVNNQNYVTSNNQRQNISISVCHYVNKETDHRYKYYNRYTVTALFSLCAHWSHMKGQTSEIIR